MKILKLGNILLAKEWGRLRARNFYMWPFICSYKKWYKKNMGKSTNIREIGLVLGLSFVCYEFVWKRSYILNEHYKMGIQLPKVHALTEKEDLNVRINHRTMFNFLADVAEKTSPSVVYIEMVAKHPYSRKNIPLSNGSGFIVKSDGLILTNAHVVQNNGYRCRVIVKLFNGKEYEGVVENYDTKSDLATVRIKAKDLPVLPLGKSSKIRAGEFVIAMGNPLTLSHTITAGVVSSPHRAGQDLGLHKQTEYIQTDAAINVGNSGGPLVNLDCEAIGINTIKVTEGISFAIPSDLAIKFLEKTEGSNKGSWYSFNKSSSAPNKQKFLGITMLTLSPSIIRELKERNPEFPNVTHGVLVWRVMFSSPSDEAGVRPGDVIIAINGKDAYCASDIYNRLEKENTLRFRIIRKKEEFDITVQPVDPLYP